MSSSTTVVQLRRNVEQLRREADIKRIPVSVAIKDLKEYVTEYRNHDLLLTGFSNKKANQYREPNPCSVL